MNPHDELSFPETVPVLSTVAVGRDGSRFALELGPLTHDDIDDIARICRQESIQRWTQVPSPYTRGDAEWFVGHAGKAWRESSEIIFAIRAGEERRDAGTISLMGIDSGAAHAEIGYWVSEEFVGRGVATAALQAVVEWAFDYGLLRATLLVATGNAGSLRVAEKAGFEREGVMKSRIRRKDVVHDMVVWGRVSPALAG